MDPLLADLGREYRYHKDMAERAMGELDDREFFLRPAELSNPVALIVKHLAGNLESRWTDFLTSDGDKASRDRNGEFLLTERDTRAELLAAWERGWRALFETIENLQPTDLDTIVTIRGEPHTARQALLRGLSHAAYHVGQIAYLVRMIRPQSRWLTIPPGQSQAHPAGYLKPRP
jgi:hypothetical protein